MDLFKQCDYCKGMGTSNEYSNFKDADGNRHEVHKKVVCKECGGKGTTVARYTGCVYEYVHNKRLADHYWKMLKHESPIPYWYFSNSCENCNECRGRGEIEEITHTDGVEERVYHKCKTCNGEGIIHTKTTKQIYEDIFQKYLESKNFRNYYKTALKNKEWIDSKYDEFKDYIPHGYWQVCVRCEKNNDGTDGDGGMDTCCGCVNESMCNENGYSYFKPYNEAAKLWYNNGGFKLNICYDSKHNYKV